MTRECSMTSHATCMVLVGWGLVGSSQRPAASRVPRPVEPRGVLILEALSHPPWENEMVPALLEQPGTVVTTWIGGSDMADRTRERPRRRLMSAERFWFKVAPGGTDDCWLWQGALDRHGYGQVGYVGASRFAHRFAYELMIGPIPVGLVIDHLCRTRACVNPLHMEPVTSAENTRRRVTVPKTHCIHGHEFTPENTYVSPRGDRICKVCRRAAVKRYYDRRRVSHEGLSHPDGMMRT